MQYLTNSGFHCDFLENINKLKYLVDVFQEALVYNLETIDQRS